MRKIAISVTALAVSGMLMQGTPVAAATHGVVNPGGPMKTPINPGGPMLGIGTVPGFHGIVAHPPGDFHGIVAKPPTFYGIVAKPPTFHGVVVAPPPVNGVIARPPDPVNGVVAYPASQGPDETLD